MPPRKSTKKVETRDNEIGDGSSSESGASITSKKIAKTKTSAKGKIAKANISAKNDVQDEADAAVAGKCVDAAQDGDVAETLRKSPTTSKTKRTTMAKKEIVEVSEIVSEVNPTAKGKRKAKAEPDEGEAEVKEKSTVKKRKTKQEIEDEAVPLAARTEVSTLKRAIYVGAHVSASGGVQNAINNSLHVGANAFALFLKSQRKWTSPPLAPETSEQFKAFCKEHQYDAAKHCLPHGSYLVNLAQADPQKAAQAFNCFVDDLQRCEALGIRLYNFHPGSTGANPRPEAIARIAKALNKAHAATKTVITVLENMAGAGNVIGSTWEDLRDIISQVDEKARVGVCIDTCHTFAAGYDLRTPATFKKTMDDFSNVVGMKYLKALHLNDSKAPMSSNRDLHANIGTGFLGLRAFHNVVNFEPFQHLPMVLETPIDRKGPDGKTIEDKDVWATEIKLLEGLIGADVESEEFKATEQRLQDEGAEERQKIQAQVDKKTGSMKGQKNIASMFKPVKKGKKGGATPDEEADGSVGEGCSH